MNLCKEDIVLLVDTIFVLSSVLISTLSLSTYISWHQGQKRACDVMYECSFMWMNSIFVNFWVTVA